MSKQGEKKDKMNILSLEDIKQKHEEKFQMAEAYVELDGEMLSYKMYEHFPQSIKDEYYQELLEFMIGLSTGDDKYEGLDNAITIFTLILLVDKFTDLGLPDEPKEKVMYAKYLDDFNILSTIMSTFEEEEVDELMTETNKIVKSQSEKMVKALEEYESKSEDIEDLSSLRLIEKELGEEDSGEQNNNQERYR